MFGGACFFCAIVPADIDKTGPSMQRERRQAATNALQKIQRIREWEDMPENSKRFRECAARIEAEFRAEERQQQVLPEDIPSDGVDESSDEYESANESFVSSAGEEISECEYVPGNDEAAEEDEELSTGDTESDVPPPSDSESDSDSEIETQVSQAETVAVVSASSSTLSGASTIEALDL
jgi:hypothetical protein